MAAVDPASRREGGPSIALSLPGSDSTGCCRDSSIEGHNPLFLRVKGRSTALLVSHATGFAAAVPLLKRAVEIDPQFAMAYASLGLMYSSIGEAALSAESTSTAYQLRNRASEGSEILDFTI